MATGDRRCPTTLCLRSLCRRRFLLWTRLRGPTLVSSEESERDETIRPSRGWEELILPENFNPSGSVDALRDRVRGDIIVPPLPSRALIGVPPSVPVVGTTVTDVGDVVIASSAYSALLPPPVPLLSLSIPRPPSVAFSGPLPSSKIPSVLPPPPVGLSSRRPSSASSRIESSLFRKVSKTQKTLGTMSGSHDVEGGSSKQWSRISFLREQRKL